MPAQQPPLTFFDVTIPVTTVKQNLVALILAEFTANRPDYLRNGYLDFTAMSRVQFTADSGNGAIVLVVGDSYASYGTPSQGTELTVGGPVNGYWIPSYSDTETIDLTEIFVVASANGGYLHVRAYR